MQREGECIFGDQILERHAEQLSMWANLNVLLQGSKHGALGTDRLIIQ